jgi:hypothetical protein
MRCRFAASKRTVLPVDSAGLRAPDRLAGYQSDGRAPATEPTLRLISEPHPPTL